MVLITNKLIISNKYLGDSFKEKSKNIIMICQKECNLKMKVYSKKKHYNKLKKYIDWSPFFHAWGIKGVYPKILKDSKKGIEATKLLNEANEVLDLIINENLFTVKGVYGIYKAKSKNEKVNILHSSHTLLISSPSLITQALW